jgi:hypothetical protein
MMMFIGMRAKNIFKRAYQETPSVYKNKVLTEFEKLQRIDSTDEVYLWFEDDLFCQCNMWFAVDYLYQWSQPKMYRVFPEADAQNWKGFGRAEADDLLNISKTHWH